MTKFYVGIDEGGTFTDGVVIDDEGRVGIFKTPSVPGDPSLGLFTCLEKAARSFGLSLNSFLASLRKLTYGTTVATNMLLEGKGARTGLITTWGFRDALPVAGIGREYLGIDLQVERFPPLIPRSFIVEVQERIDRDGQVVTPLDLATVREAITFLEGKGAEAVAVSLLWSFKNPQHELGVREKLVEHNPKLYISLSCEVAPVMGEYERAATVVLNSLLGPPIRAHLQRLMGSLAERGLEIALLVMQSTGGVVPAEDAAAKPVTLLNSGPAGGVVAAKYLCELLGLPNAICIDMGGTSFDASLITEGHYSASLVSRAMNHNIFVPMIDISSIGAGGGSIAWLDMGRRLKVGPQSAGAIPGPACYGRGGEEPTVTDADLVLGRLNPRYFLGGEMALDEGRARKAIEERIAQPLGMSLSQAAAGISQIVDAKMVDALRAVLVEKGVDPRDYVLVAFGGAGPVHASSLARELGIRTVVIPRLAPVFSAFGIVASDIVHSFSLSEVMGLADPGPINRNFQALEERGLGLLRREGLAAAEMATLRYADMRYTGQFHQVTVPVPGKQLAAEDMAELVADFERKYQSLYGEGTLFPEAGLEIVTFRVEVVGRTPKPVIPGYPEAKGDASQALKERRAVFFKEKGGFVSTPVFDGEKLEAGQRLPGPAVVEYAGTTAVVLPDQEAEVDPYLNLVLR